MNVRKIWSDIKKLFLIDSNNSSRESSDRGAQEPFKWDIYAPCNGRIIDQKEIGDEAFSTGAMGVGLGIMPADGDFDCFADGKMSVVYHTNHAYFISRENDPQISIMLHIGINTVDIDVSKQVFRSAVQVGDEVKVGDALCKANLDGIVSEGKKLDTALLVQNENMEGKQVIFHSKSGDDVRKGDLLMSVVSA